MKYLVSFISALNDLDPAVGIGDLSVLSNSVLCVSLSTPSRSHDGSSSSATGSPTTAPTVSAAAKISVDFFKHYDRFAVSFCFVTVHDLYSSFARARWAGLFILHIYMSLILIYKHV